MSNHQELRQQAQEALERAEKTTFGPWRLRPMPGRQNVVEPDYDNHSFTGVAFSHDNDAKFVAHARDDVPLLATALLETVCELEKAEDKAEELLVLLRLALIRLEEYGDREIAPLLRDRLEEAEGE